MSSLIVGVRNGTCGVNLGVSEVDIIRDVVDGVQSCIIGVSCEFDVDVICFRGIVEGVIAGVVDNVGASVLDVKFIGVRVGVCELHSHRKLFFSEEGTYIVFICTGHC